MPIGFVEALGPRASRARRRRLRRRRSSSRGARRPAALVVSRRSSSRGARLDRRRPRGHPRDLPLQISRESFVRATPPAEASFAGYYEPGWSCLIEAPRRFCENPAPSVFTGPAFSPPVHLSWPYLFWGSRRESPGTSRAHLIKKNCLAGQAGPLRGLSHHPPEPPGHT